MTGDIAVYGNGLSWGETTKTIQEAINAASAEDEMGEEWGDLCQSR